MSAITATIRRDGALLRLGYRLAGDLAALRVPPPAAPVRRDGLWRHACFEAFVMADDGPAYREFNFSPSGEWAAYGFAACRQGMAPLELTCAPRIECAVTGDELRLSVVLVARDAALGGSSRVGLSAVIEDVNGALSYFALVHPRERPDFHDPAGFVLQLPVD